MIGRVSSVGTATRYGLDGAGIESRWRRDFPHTSRPALGPTQPGYRAYSRGLSGRGVALTTHPPSSAKVKERVELYIPPPKAFVVCYRVNLIRVFEGC